MLRPHLRPLPLNQVWTTMTTPLATNRQAKTTLMVAAAATVAVAVMVAAAATVAVVVVGETRVSGDASAWAASAG